MIIPKIFHRAWVGSRPIPQAFEDYWRGWQDNHPDWDFTTWTDESLESFGLVNKAQYDSAYEAAGKTDIAMHEILRKFGGVWLCCDMECFRNIEPLIEDVDGFCGRQTTNELLGAIMGIVPNHPLSDRLVQGIPDSVRQYRGIDLCSVAGPLYLTRTLEEFFDMPADKIVNVADFRVLDNKIVYPFLWTEAYAGREAYPEAYCCHHWAGSWKQL